MRPRRVFASSRRRCEPREGFVGTRGRGGGARPSRTRSPRRSRAVDAVAVLGTVLRGGGGERYAAQSCALPVVEHPRRARVEGQLDPAVGGVDRLPAGTRRLREPFLQLGLGDHQPAGHARTRPDHEVHQRALHSIAGQVSMTIRTPASTRAPDRVLVDHAELEPHGLRAHLDRLVGELAGGVGAPEDVDHVDRERYVGQRRVALLAEHRRRVRVHRHDPLATSLQQRRDPVRRAGRVAGEADDRPRLAVVEHERHVVRVLPAHGVHGSQRPYGVLAAVADGSLAAVAESWPSPSPRDWRSVRCPSRGPSRRTGTHSGRRRRCSPRWDSSRRTGSRSGRRWRRRSGRAVPAPPRSPR